MAFDRWSYKSGATLFISLKSCAIVQNWWSSKTIEPSWMRLSHPSLSCCKNLFEDNFISSNIQRRSFLLASETNHGICFRWRWIFSASFACNKNSAKQRSVKSSNPELSRTKSILAFLLLWIAFQTSSKLSTIMFPFKCWRWAAFAGPCCPSISPLEMERSQRFPHKQNWKRIIKKGK